MITKGKLSNSPSILLTYLYMDKKDKTKVRGDTLIQNCCYGNSVDDMVQQFKDISQLSRRCKRNVLHCSFSFSPNDKEKVSENSMIEIAQKFSKKFNLDENAWVAVLHKDTEFPHFHMAICTINPNTGKAIDHSHNYRRMSEFSRECELDFNLESVLSPRKFLPKEQQNLPRKDKRKDDLKKAIIESLSKSTSLPEFDDRIKEYGYKVERSRGIAFTDSANVRFKGSQVGYSLDEIKKQLINNLSIKLVNDTPKNIKLSL